MKKAIVIGGTSGIGRALTEILISNSYRVAITGIETDIIKDLQNSGNENLVIKYLDCTKESSSEIISELVVKLGGLDLLILSAGIGNLNKNLGFKVENSANMLNVLAFTEIADWSYRFFEKQGYGHFVAISSVSGLFGSRVAPAYHAAKAYQITYLEGLRQKVKKSKLPIYVTDIRPGFVDTPMTNGKRMIWVATKEKAAKQAFNIIKQKKGFGYVTKRWYIVGFILKHLPSWIRTRL